MFRRGSGTSPGKGAGEAGRRATVEKAKGSATCTHHSDLSAAAREGCGHLCHLVVLCPAHARDPPT